MKLNRKNILSFRAYLARLRPNRFRMDEWGVKRGTASCLAGHAWRHFEKRKALRQPCESPSDRLTGFCRKKFRFSKEQAETVFEMWGTGLRDQLSVITLKEALYVWDRIIETGEVLPKFWREALRKSQREERLLANAPPMPLAKRYAAQWFGAADN